jgi:hypothetical protein
VHRNCLLKHAVEGKTEETKRRGRIHKHILDVLREKKRSAS